MTDLRDMIADALKCEVFVPEQDSDWATTESIRHDYLEVADAVLAAIAGWAIVNQAPIRPVQPAPDGPTLGEAPQGTGEADRAVGGDSPYKLTVHGARHLIGILDHLAQERDQARAELAALKQRVREALPPAEWRPLESWLGAQATTPAATAMYGALAVRRAVLAALDGEGGRG